MARPEEALALLEEERKLLERAGAATPASSLSRRLGEALDAIAWSYNCSGDIDAAIAASRKAFDHWLAVSGVDSVDLALPLGNLEDALQRAHRNDEALDAAREVVRLREARLGDSPSLAQALSGEGEALAALERWEDALSVYERSLRIARATMTPGDLNFCWPLLQHGKLLLDLGRLDEAQRDFDEAVALFDKVGGKGTNLAIALHGHAIVAARRGRCADALVDDARAIKVLEDVAPASSLLLEPLSGSGGCLVRLGRPAEAIPLLERALAIRSSTDLFEQAKAKAYLGRARVETGRDVNGGLAMARAARATIAAAPDGAEELRWLDRWLATHAH
jgi:tetratricopeptide (TPR) repeat protein